MKCKILDEPITNFMSFGKMPIANGFLKKEQFDNEFFFDMQIGFSNKISLFQLINHPKPEQMFNNQYPFFSGSSIFMRNHFRDYSNWLKKYLKKNLNLIEIGSNDGTLLENFNNSNINAIGIEPSKNVYELSIKKKVKTYNNFFNTDIIGQFPKLINNVDVICAANVICHIPDLNNLIKTIDKFLDSKGVFVFEEPYLGSMYDKISFDQIYDEHIYMFSAAAVKKIFNIFDFELVDVLPQITHGGSLRYVVARKNKFEINKNVFNILDDEKRLNIDNIEGCLVFKKKCEDSKSKINNKLKSYVKAGKRIVGYAATSKSTTILNYCDIGAETIEYICDTTEEKVGKFSPGKHIPIVSIDHFRKDKPDIVYLFAWNHKNEIIEKENKINNQFTWISHVEI